MAILPRLLHPIPVWLRKADREFTAAYDHNLREPVGQVRREQKPIKLVAQISVGNADDPKASQGGVVEDSDGYLLFLTRDLKRAKVEVDRGDRVIKIGEGDNEREVDYYITKLKWMGHYPHAGGPTMVRAYFEDRHPSHQRGDL